MKIISLQPYHQKKSYTGQLSICGMEMQCQGNVNRHVEKKHPNKGKNEKLHSTGKGLSAKTNRVKDNEGKFRKIFKFIWLFSNRY